MDRVTKLRYVIDSVIGYADCFWGEMTYEQTIGGWDIDNYPDIAKHPAYAQAEKAGLSL